MKDRPRTETGTHLRLVEVPYDSGHWGTRMGRGPGALASAGAVQRLRAAGHTVESERLSVATPFPVEVSTAFHVNRVLAERVRAAVWHSRFPVVLAGNCMSCLGVLAGIGAPDTGIVWLDAHGDFNTPETTSSGFLDGMALSVATGRCWRRMALGVTGFRPIDPSRVLLVGARDLDPAECTEIEQAGVERVAPADVRTRLPVALDRLRQQVEQIYLHVDLDVLDPAEGSANGYASPHGLTLAQVREVIRSVQAAFRVRAATLSAYDPAYDLDGRAGTAALEILETIAGGRAPVPAPEQRARGLRSR